MARDGDPRPDPRGRRAGRDRAPARARDRRAVRRRAAAARGGRDPDDAAAAVRRRRAAGQPRPGDGGPAARRSSATLADEGDAVVIVEHRVEEALELRPDRVLYLEDGAIAYLGDRRGLPRRSPTRPRSSCRSRSSSRRPGARDPAAADAAPEASRRATAEPTAPERDRAGAAAPRVPRRPSPATASARSCTASTRVLGRAETVAVLGPNGSGKTTLFRTAMRPHAARPTGAVLVDGEPIGRARPSRSSPPSSATSSRAPARCCSPGRSARSCSSGRATSGRDPADFDGLVADVLARVGARRRRGHPRAAAADALVRPAEAAGARDRPRPPARDADPRRALGRPGPPDRDALHGRGPGDPAGSRASTSSRTTWTLH